MGFYRKFVEIAKERRWLQVLDTQSAIGQEPLSLAMEARPIRKAILCILI
jgi:hypothetical protein